MALVYIVEDDESIREIETAINENGEIVTLGRGGSDTTAVSIAAASAGS